VRAPGVGFETASLILLFLYGNLFCYVASYPILVFHATRVIDFSNDRWRHQPLDGYIATFFLGIAALIAAHCFPQHRRCLAFGFTLLFAILQILRVWWVLADKNRRVISGSDGIRGESGGEVTLLYSYARSLATRRGQREKIVQTEKPLGDNKRSRTSQRVITKRGEALWHKEYIETYRHLREHGNSAFIFVLELVLATLIYCITIPSESGAKQLSAIGLLFAIWAFPALSAHLIGQFLERRFSHYERRLIE